MTCLLVASALLPQAGIAEAYSKREVMVPMRDGTHLYTVLYEPRDTSERHPILLERTVYSAGPYGATNYRNFPGSPEFAKRRYAFVFQDVRGKYRSEGTFEDVRPDKMTEKGTDETTDTYDTIDWLVKNVPHNNGRVGLWGISYPGFYAAIGAASGHPALRAASPQAPVTNWWIGDDFRHHGALYLQDAFSFLAYFGQERPAPSDDMPPSLAPKWSDGYRFFLDLGPIKNADAIHFKGRVKLWNDLLNHPNYDAFWKARDVRPRLKNVHCAVLTVGGLYDAEDMWGALATYRAMESQNPGIKNTLVMGPWSHGMWAWGPGNRLGDFDFGQETATFFREKVEFPFFDHYLRDAEAPPLPEALVFDTGDNKWRAFAQFPPRATLPLTLYLAEEGGLSPARPRTKDGSDTYESDPAHPVPFTMEIRPNRNREYMIADQRFASRRPDVLSYRTPPLTDDIVVVGPVKAELKVTTSGTDADFVVKVIDVLPDDLEVKDGVPYGGYERLVRAEVVRGRYRNSPERPTAMRSGHPETVTLSLNDVLHTFKKGHRMMVQIQSTWFPLVDRNPQTFVDIAKADASDFQSATIEVLRNSVNASSITFGIPPQAGTASKAKILQR